ncbi:MAG: hypothetical protein OXH19_04950 [Chloroflexi bacterium]|nr:hypothetical protein [Chloroflexota bacterium]MCY3588507.1 hypothetical protein [Chloroflexota bacterium]MCY3685784.1 hypothetical protein [Chloroflexota bacterium]MDE2709229.1 hypothetical protein [Chloroflexota bacterium]
MDPRQQLTLLAAAMTRDALVANGASEVSFEPPVAGSLATACSANGASGFMAACPLFDLAAVQGDGPTLARKVGLEERLHAYGGRDLVLWVPPGAPLPDDADHAAGQIADAARDLEVGEKGEVTFKVDVAVRKTGSDGSYMSVLGGLSQQWARFTNQVMGEYQLDASNIYRLPEDEQKITQMVDFLVLVANGIRKEGVATTVKGEDTWRIQRLGGVEEPIVVCAPPTSVVDGRMVRRLMRRSLREAEEAIGGASGFRIASMVTLANSLDRELVTTALRGIDPLLLADWDYMPLLVDGQTRTLLEPSAPLA